ncbi:MAG: DNA polymerase III subunit gamma/tau [Chloroflexota bacterium]|nr:DNA polymerase III subunit gamma/tau [Chloroflexota bacterium]
MSEVLYRKWRPQSFSEVAGQDAVTHTLRNSVAAGRLAHAYLFCGPRGTGKTTLGRLLAKAAGCAAPVDGEPCNECASCISFNEGRAFDFVEQDAASNNGVDDIRKLRERIISEPGEQRFKVWLLDEVHMLSVPAQNAFLKTLEEPPPRAIFVLCTTEAHKVSGTIISRCQRFDLKRIPMSAAQARLAFICEKEGLTLDAASLEEIARAATGSLRDGINALEQVVTYYGKSPTHEQVWEALGLSVDARSGQLARLALEGDLTGGLMLIAQVRDDGIDIKQFAKQVVKYLRGLLLAKAGASESLDLPQEMAAEVKADAARLAKGDIICALQLFGRIDFREDAAASGGSLPLELALVEFVSAAGEPRAEAAAPKRAPQPAPKAAPRAARPPAEAPVIERAVPVAEPLVPEVIPIPEPVPVATPLEPTPVTVSASDAAPSGDLLERVRQSLKESEKQLSALLNGSCELKSSEGATVVLGFYHTFHLERIERGGYKGKLEEAFSIALGRKVTVIYEHSPQERATGDKQRTGGHLVQAAQEMGARAVPRQD